MSHLLRSQPPGESVLSCSFSQNRTHWKTCPCIINKPRISTQRQCPSLTDYTLGHHRYVRILTNVAVGVLGADILRGEDLWCAGKRAGVCPIFPKAARKTSSPDSSWYRPSTLVRFPTSLSLYILFLTHRGRTCLTGLCRSSKITQLRAWWSKCFIEDGNYYRTWRRCTVRSLTSRLCDDREKNNSSWNFLSDAIYAALFCFTYIFT